MKSFVLALTVLLSASSVHATDNELSQTILTEYTRLRALVTSLKPEFEVGGFLNGKMYGDYKLLWRTSDRKGDNEVIRIYRDKGQSQQAFVVEYYFSNIIVEGKTVVRRFVGPAATGWRNDTVDFISGKYLGRQGSTNPYLDARDLEILKEWDIRFFVELQ